MLGQFSSVVYFNWRSRAAATSSIDKVNCASRGVLVAVPKVGVSATIGGANGVYSTAIAGGADLIIVLAFTLSANASELTP